MIEIFCDKKDIKNVTRKHKLWDENCIEISYLFQDLLMVLQISGWIVYNSKTNFYGTLHSAADVFSVQTTNKTMLGCKKWGFACLS